MNRILIIDEKESIYFFLKTIIESSACIIDTATDYIEACKMLRTHTYDVLIAAMDIESDSLTDRACLFDILQDLSCNIRLITLTDSGNPDSMEAAYGIGADFYFEKPVTLRVMANSLESLGVAFI